jgi:hypothetical protein
MPRLSSRFVDSRKKLKKLIAEDAKSQINQILQGYPLTLL